MEFANIGRVSDFPNRECFFSVGNDVIPVAPGVFDFLFDQLRKMDKDFQSSISVPLGLQLLSKRLATAVLRLFSFTFSKMGEKYMTRCFPEMTFSSISFRTNQLRNTFAKRSKESMWGRPKKEIIFDIADESRFDQKIIGGMTRRKKYLRGEGVENED